LEKKKNPADSAAQHLANLIGTSVTGFVPQPPNDKVDLNTELFLRSNVAMASLAIISALIKGHQNQRELILKSVKPEYMGKKSFENYLFGFLSSELKEKGDISIPAIEKKIPEYSMVVYGEPTNEKTLEGDFFKWSQVLNFEPTDTQTTKAIEILHNWARKEGLLGEI
jgi:hypothetical protein